MLSKVDEPGKEPYDNYNSEMCSAIVAVIKNSIPHSSEFSCCHYQFNSWVSVLKTAEEWEHF